MQLDLARCSARLFHESVREPVGGWPEGAPECDYKRSPVASRVGHFASQSGLRLFHYEYREQWDLPGEWMPEGTPDEFALAPEWERGVLPERKYHSFRHDQMIGGFNPGHRGKWTTHELCHGLVGYGYHSEMSRLFLATAGRLSELVPVVLWYFLDEIGLQRCPIHQGGEALFQAYCPDCEACAQAGSTDSRAQRRLEDAGRFMEAELAAIARTRRLGRPVSHQWVTINLCSDGLAYAHSHYGRLCSPVFTRYAERFIMSGGGHSETLDELEARALDVFYAISGQQEGLQPWAPSREHGRLRWLIQDTGWRLSAAVSGIDGALYQEGQSILDGLGEACQLTQQGARPASQIEELYSSQVDRIRTFDAELGDGTAASICSVGYPIFQFGLSQSLVEEGLVSGVPLTMQLLDDAGYHRLVGQFAQTDMPCRRSLMQRWVDFLRSQNQPLLTELAEYEVALLSVRPNADVLVLGGWNSGEGRLAKSYRLQRFEYNIVELASLVESGALFGELQDGRFRVTDETGCEPTVSKLILLLGYEPRGEMVIADVDELLAGRLESGEFDQIESTTLDWLNDIGALEPRAWSI